MTTNIQLTKEEIEKILNFQKILDGIARKGDGGTHIKLSNKYSPTELSACVRGSYYARVFPQEYDNKSYRNFLLGNVLHDVFQTNLDYKLREKVLGKVLEGKIRYLENEKSYHYLIPLEKTDNQRIIISGRLDSIIFLHGYDKPVVVDYKTTSMLKYSMDAPKDAHVAQLNFYLGCTLADYGMVVYVDKKNLEVVQHTVDWSATKFNEMIDYAITLNKHLNAGTVPPCDLVKMKKEGYCNYCNYAQKCRAAEAIQ